MDFQLTPSTLSPSALTSSLPLKHSGPSFGLNQRGGVQSGMSVFGAQQSDGAEGANKQREEIPEETWFSSIQEKWTELKQTIKDFVFTLGVKVFALPVHHILLRPALMRKILPHGNVQLLAPKQKELLDKRYESHENYQLIHGKEFFNEMQAGKEIQLQGHWLMPKKELPKYLAVLCNGVAADWTYQLAMAEKLVDDGAAVFMFNNRGHGESSDELCTMGYHEAKDLAASIIHAHENFKDMLPQELETKLKRTRQKAHWSKVGDKHPPVFLYGHSMGGAEALFVPKTVPNNELKRVNQIVDGIVIDSGYAQLDVFSELPRRIKYGARRAFEEHDWVKVFSESRTFKLPFADKEVTVGPWITEEKIDQFADGSFVKAVTKTLNDRMLSELKFKNKGGVPLKKLEDVIPGKLSAEKASREVQSYHNSAPLDYLKKPLLYLYAADDSDVTTPGHKMQQNIEPINALRKEHGAKVIQEVPLYGYTHNASDIWYPFKDLPSETIEEVAGKKNANLWDGLGVTTSLRRGALIKDGYTAYQKEKESDSTHTSAAYSEDVQVKAITDFFKETLKKAA